ncbi:MAG TPA: class I SAM-dependent rRNA methyltransferase [Kofleriaceae bacterium]
MRARWRVTKPLRDRIAEGHPWIYDRAVETSPAPDHVVTLVDERGPLATALADPSSPIRARVLDLDPDATCDAAWAERRARDAAGRRVRDPLLAHCTGRRLIHGEADGCAGLVIDCYADTAVVVYDGPAAASFWSARLSGVLAGLDAHVRLAHVWVRGDRKDRGGRVASAVRGDPPAEIVISEDEARFAVDVRAGQKTGFFLDQRENRRLVRRHAAGARVLNAFCYTGGFSLHAALGGAAHVTSIDVAGPAITALRHNVELSGLVADRHDAIAIDAFDFFAQAAARRDRWDLVIVDPPSFAPSEKAKPAALASYGKLVDAALAVTAPNGRFALASCSSHITEADLLALCARPGLRLRAALGAASDHPVLPAFPEGRYLKFLLFDV